MSNPNYTPPPPPPPTTNPPSSADSNRTIMVVLAYLWLLALIPLLVEKNDNEVRWHAKNGLVLTAAEFIVWIVLTVFSAVVPVLGTLAGCAVMPFVWVAFIILHIIAMVKGLQGNRFYVPGISQYADKF